MQDLLNKEKDILDILWAADRPYLISDILRTDASLNRNTVAKALVSLEQKGYIRVDSIQRTITRSGRAYVPAITPDEYEFQLKLKNSLCQGTTVKETRLSLFSALLETESINDDFIEELESMIQSYKKNKSKKE